MGGLSWRRMDNLDLTQGDPEPGPMLPKSSPIARDARHQAIVPRPTPANPKGPAFGRSSTLNLP